MLESFDALMGSGLTSALVQLAGDRGVKSIVDQSRFPGAGDTGDAGEQADWYSDVNGLQVVAGGPQNPEYSYRISRPA